MANIKDLLKPAECQPARSILNAAGDLGKKENMQVYVVGGFVRDLIMGKPLNDIDIMIVGEGIPFARKLADELGLKKIIPFEKFGTAIIPNREIQIEVATARKENYSDDSRKPSEIIYTDLQGDLLRRDFTINACLLYTSPSPRD